MPNTTNSTQQVELTFTNKLNKFLSKFNYWIVIIILTISGSIYNQTLDRISKVEDQVQFLYQDKVSKEELREVSSKLTREVIELKSDITRQQNEMKSDILSRLDYILRVFSTQNQNNKTER